MRIRKWYKLGSEYRSKSRICPAKYPVAGLFCFYPRGVVVALCHERLDEYGFARTFVNANGKHEWHVTDVQFVWNE